MRAILNFFSSTAAALMLAGVIMVVLSDSSIRFADVAAAQPMQGDGLVLDHVSLLIGIAAGWLIAVLGRIPWFQLPQRAVQWLLRHERNFFRVAMVGLFVAVLYFY